MTIEEFESKVKVGDPVWITGKAEYYDSQAFHIMAEYKGFDVVTQELMFIKKIGISIKIPINLINDWFHNPRLEMYRICFNL